MKRIALILVFVLLLTQILISCGQSVSDPVKASVKAQEEKNKYSLDSIPAMDLEEREIGLFGCRGTLQMINVQEETGDIVSDAIFRRNITVEDKYNFKFNMFEAPPEIGTNMIRQFVLSGDKTYHIYQGVQHKGMPSMILSGYFVDWNELDAIHYDNPYWNTNISDDLNFGGRIYVMSGDLNLRTYNDTNCLLFNKRLFDDIGIDYPYQSVYDKEWTIDKFIEIVKQGYSDLNGDTVIDKESDRMGYAGWGYGMHYALYVGMGGETVVNDENKMPVLAINNDRTILILDKFIELFDGKNSFINYVDYSIDKNMFLEGRLLMDDDCLKSIAKNRDSEFEIGLLPYPMLDNTQENYRSRASDTAALTYIPTTNKELVETGVILEAMAIESYNTIRPVYYDITLDLKSASDEETKDMVDIVVSTSTWLYDGFITHGFLNGVAEKQTNNFASWYAQMERGFKKQVERIERFYS